MGCIIPSEAIRDLGKNDILKATTWRHWNVSGEYEKETPAWVGHIDTGSHNSFSAVSKENGYWCTGVMVGRGAGSPLERQLNMSVLAEAKMTTISFNVLHLLQFSDKQDTWQLLMRSAKTKGRPKLMDPHGDTGRPRGRKSPFLLVSLGTLV